MKQLEFIGTTTLENNWSGFLCVCVFLPLCQGFISTSSSSHADSEAPYFVPVWYPHVGQFYGIKHILIMYPSSPAPWYLLFMRNENIYSQKTT